MRGLFAPLGLPAAVLSGAAEGGVALTAEALAEGAMLDGKAGVLATEALVGGAVSEEAR